MALSADSVREFLDRFYPEYGFEIRTRSAQGLRCFSQKGRSLGYTSTREAAASKFFGQTKSHKFSGMARS